MFNSMEVVIYIIVAFALGMFMMALIQYKEWHDAYYYVQDIAKKMKARKKKKSKPCKSKSSQSK